MLVGRRRETGRSRYPGALERPFHAKGFPVASPLGLLAEPLRGGVRGKHTDLSHYLRELFQTEFAGRGINCGSERCGDAVSLPVPYIAFGKVGVVENDTSGLAAESGRDREVNAAGIEICEIVNGDGSVMGDHCEATTPQGPSDEIVMVTHGPFGKSKNSPGDTLPIAFSSVIGL